MIRPLIDMAPGTITYFYNEPCVVLEHRKDGTLLMACEQIRYIFGAYNNYGSSDLMEHLNGSYLDALTQNHRDVVLDRTVDLTALNGSKEYGSVTCKVAPLTFIELCKYRGIIPEPKGFEWTVTPWSTPSVLEDYTDGSYYLCTINHAFGRGYEYGFGYCSATGGVRPAFLVSSNFSIKDEVSGLDSYSVDELLDEISRRIHQGVQL